MRLVQIYTILLKLGIKNKINSRQFLRPYPTSWPGFLFNSQSSFFLHSSTHRFLLKMISTNPKPTHPYQGMVFRSCLSWSGSAACLGSSKQFVLSVLRRMISLPLYITQWPESTGFTLIHNRDYLHSTFSVEDLTVDRKGASTSYALT